MITPGVRLAPRVSRVTGRRAPVEYADAMEQSWFPGTDEDKAAIGRHLRRAQHEAYARGRLSRAPRKVHTHQARGQWIV